MFVTCPACSTRFAAAAKDFPPEGRDVRCARCGNIWHQAPPVADPDPDIFEGEGKAQDETVDDIRRNLDEEAEAAMARRRARLGETTPMRETKPDAPSLWPLVFARIVLGFGWGGAIVLMLGIGWAVVTYRPQIVQYWPQSASLYATVGIKPDLAALKFTDVAYASAIEDGQPVLTVSGKLVNDGTKEQGVPPIRAALYDGAKREVFHWTFTPKVLTLSPSQIVRFSSKVASPPSASRNLELRFVQGGEL